MIYLRYLLLLIPLWTAQADIVVLEANESPPYWSNSLPGGGLGSELVQAISDAVGLQTQINFVPLSRMIEDKNNNDLGNPEFYMAQQEFAAIIPFAITEAAIFYYRPRYNHALKLTGFNDLKQYRLGVLKGTLIDRHAFEQMGLHFESSYAQASLFKKLKLGRIDLVFEIDLVGRQMIAQLFPEQKDDFIRQPLPNSISPIAIMLDAEYPHAVEIAAQYRKGLAAIIANGRYQQIVEKYYPDGQLPSGWFANLQRFQQLYSF
ncbi:MAG: transporter substrate-binding domain-containing protein [Methylobacter sp.]|nr:MAG: transporter substrate-binding domain-containing protein [Methylobacter sp.]